MLTQSLLKELLIYNPNTGNFTWNVSLSNKITCGDIAGTITCPSEKNEKVYRQIKIQGKSYLAHRLAFLYMTGSFPKGIVDHRDRNGLNNKWNNLKDVSNTENNFNQSIRQDNTSGIKGVSFLNKRQKWRAQIQINSKTQCLYYGDSFEEACKARKLAEEKYLNV